MIMVHGPPSYNPERKMWMVSSKFTCTPPGPVFFLFAAGMFNFFYVKIRTLKPTITMFCVLWLVCIMRCVRILHVWFRPLGEMPRGSDPFIKIICTQNAMFVWVVPSAGCASFIRLIMGEIIPVIYFEKCAIKLPINRSLPLILPVLPTFLTLLLSATFALSSSTTAVLDLSTTFLSFSAAPFLFCCRFVLQHVLLGSDSVYLR